MGKENTKKVFRKSLAICLSLIIALSSMVTCFSTVTFAADEVTETEIKIDETKSITISNNTNITYLKFTPKYSGKYKFYSLNGNGPVGYLYNENKELITSNDDYYRFSITYDLERDTTYYWGVGSWYTETFKVKLECVESYCQHEDVTQVEAEPTRCYEVFYTAGEWCNICESWASGHEKVYGSHLDANADDFCDLCERTMPLGSGTMDGEGSSEGSSGDSGGYYDDSISYYMYPDGTVEIYGHGGIRENAFYNNTEIKKVIIFDGITSINYGAFYNCKNLESVTIPDSVKKIGTSAFEDCTSLEKIVIPDSVTSIGKETFRNCKSLKSVTIGNGVTYIGGDAFYYCRSLDAVYIKDVAAWCNIEYGDSDAMPLGYAGNLYLNGELVEDFVVPDSVTSIDNYVFHGWDSLETIVIPDSVASIGSYAFYYCKNLKSVTIGNGVTSISDCAFYNCESLKSVTIGNSVTSIGEETFYNCKSLETIVIPDSVTSIGYSAFEDCKSLKSVTIGNSVTSIGSYAFKHCHYADIVISAGVTGINSNAFSCAEYEECNGDNSFYCYKDSYAHTWLIEEGYEFALVDGTTEENTVSGRIGTYSWSLNKLTGVLTLSGSGKMVDFTSAAAPWDEYNSLIKEIQLPDGLTNIGQRAFEGLFRVNNIVIPDSVTLIDEHAFGGCQSLESIVIPDSVTNIGEYAFGYCTSLESVTIGNGVTSIGERAFYCTSIKSIVIPDSVKTIGMWAFEYCESLESIVIPNSVTSIGYNAFYYCTNLGNIEFALDEKNSSKLTSVPDISDTAIKSVFLPLSIKTASDYVFPSNIETVTICNPEFQFNSSCGLNYNSTIIGFKGSTSETFAADIGATFVDIETVHTHNYKSFEEKGYCSFGRCICGKEDKVAHTDAEPNGICDSCSKNLNDINLDTPIKVLVENGSYNYYEFTATQEGRYTLTVNEECYYLGLKDGNYDYKASSYNTKQLSYNLKAGEKVVWCVQNVDPECAYDTVIPEVELELTLTYAPNHEHSYTSTVTTQATCTTNGVKTYTCSCGDSYTQTIWSSGHSYGSWYVATTGSCSAGTVIKRDCTKCNYSDKMSFAASGKHTEVTTIARATDTHDGSVVTSCSVCGQKISEKSIAKIASVKLSATKYTYNGKTKTPSVTVKDSKGNTLVKDKDYTVSYSSGRKNAGVYTVTVKFKGNYGGTEKINFTIIPGTPTSLAYSASSTTAVKLSWGESAGATGYIVYKYNTSTKKYQKIAIVDGATTCKVSSLKAGSSYKFKIRAYKELSDGTVIYGDYTSVLTAYTKPATPTLKASSSSKGVASLSWTNVAGESGYQVYYSTKKSSGYKKLGSYKTNVVKASKKSLTSGKTYYFKVRAFTKDGSKTIYGDWSSVKSVKIK